MWKCLRSVFGLNSTSDDAQNTSGASGLPLTCVRPSVMRRTTPRRRESPVRAKDHSAEERWACKQAADGWGKRVGRKAGRQEGREWGKEHGREGGREQGRQEGREEGREQGRELGGETKVNNPLQRNSKNTKTHQLY